MEPVDFCNATSLWNCNQFGVESAWVCEPEDVVETHETLEDFVKARGEGYDIYEADASDLKSCRLFVWENQQSRPSCRRGNLFVIDAGKCLYAYFDGEA